MVEAATPKQNTAAKDAAKLAAGGLSEGEDFYYEGSLLVFTALYHLKRGYCCESGCRHCPYRDTATAPPGNALGSGAEVL